MGKPRLTFFCELPASDLKTLFAEPQLVDDLIALEASVSLGILDLSEGRAETVHHLNEVGIPVTAWLLLPKEQGYWFNVDNFIQACNCYAAFREWTAGQHLQWEAIGLDIEPDFGEMVAFGRSKWRFLPGLLWRAFDRRRLRRAQSNYRALIERMRIDGYLVESYQFPFIVDERKAGSEILQRLAGLVDLQVDREVLMLYSSFYEPNGAGFLWSYGPDCRDRSAVLRRPAIGLGSTGGGVSTGLEERRPLEWAQMARDLRMAWYWCDEIYIFSLEGCVRQGFIPYLKSFQWDQIILSPLEQAARVDKWRRRLQIGLWAGAHSSVLLGAGLVAWWLVSRLRRPIQETEFNL
ncbi:MAG TPA: hypothetical protein VE136_12495 [Anaerolineales bacterium]|nr:hypothetical protein [Anaerolineales bacterium]